MKAADVRSRRRMTLVLVTLCGCLLSIASSHVPAQASTSAHALLLTKYKIDGVVLAKAPGTGLSESAIVPQLSKLLGTPKTISASIRLCGPTSRSSEIAIDEWGDLSIGFRQGNFFQLDYNFGGWGALNRKLGPSLPPKGTTMSPLVVLVHDVTVGDTLEHIFKLDSQMGTLFRAGLSSVQTVGGTLGGVIVNFTSAPWTGAPLQLTSRVVEFGTGDFYNC